MKHVNVVCAIIKNDEGKIFVCRRGKGRLLEGVYEFPGGKIEEGETKEKTIIREIKEELLVDIMPIRYVGFSEYTYADIDKPFSISLYAYECEIISGEITLTEHTTSKYVTKDELKSLNFAAADLPLVDLI